MNTTNKRVNEDFALWYMDRKFDLIITDPPYDLNERDKLSIHKKFVSMLSENGTIIVFMPPENQWVHPASQYLFWIKPISTK